MTLPWTKTQTKLCFLQKIFSILLLLFCGNAFAQTTTTVPSTGGSWSFSNGNYGSLLFAPGFCYSVTVQAWGAGGGGTNGSGGNGGAGGGFAQATVSVTGSGSDVYYFATGSGGASNGGTGGATWFNSSANINDGASGGFIKATGGGVGSSYGSGSFGAGVSGTSWHGGAGGSGSADNGDNGGGAGGGAGPGIGGNGGNGGNGNYGNKSCAVVSCYYGSGGGGGGAGGATGSGANGASAGNNGNGVAGGGANGGGGGGGGGGGNTSCTSTSSAGSGGGGNAVGGGGGGGGGYCGSQDGGNGGNGADGNGIIGGGGGGGGADLGGWGNGGAYGGGGGGGGGGGAGGTGVLIISVTGHPVPSATASNSGPFCSGDVISVSATGSGGSGSYNYSWNSSAGGVWIAAGSPATRSPATAAMSGAYNVTVTDASTGCAITASTNVVVNPAISVSATHTDASCSSVYNGTITATATGGTTPYRYSLNGGPLQSNPTFNGVSDGTYTVGVTDNAGCTASASVTVSTIYTVSGTLDSVRNVSCFGGADGRAYVHMTGGVQPYQYSIDGLIFQSSGAFTGLTAGNYTISMRDASGCTYYQAVTISQSNVITVILDSTVNGLCAGSSSAGIYISVSGGTAPYTYLWSNSATTQDLTAISVGTYNVTVTDANSCTGTTGATVSQPLPLYVTVAEYNNVYCNGDSSAAIDITVSGGTPPYHFVWSDGETTEDIYHLPASATAYSVTVTDTNGCQKTLSQMITEPSPFVASVALNGSVCTAVGATVTLSGGVLPYTVLWSNGATTTSVTNLAPGGYTVSATDANGCVKVKAVNIVAPLSLSMAVTNAACSGGANGAIDLTVSGGTPPYTYLWNDGIMTQNRTALSQGTYTVTVTDNNTCTATASTAVNSPTPMNLTLSKTDVACQGGNTGSVTANVTGGTTPYTYVWTAGNAPYAQSQTNIGGGHYCVQVTDSSGCIVDGCIDVAGQPNPIYVTPSSKNPTCFESTDGFVSVAIVGGQPPYAFAWNTTPAQTGNIATGLNAGTYTVTISDATGCSFTQSISLTAAAQITVTSSAANLITCANGADGVIVVDVTGGTAPFLYSLNTQTQVSDTFTNVGAGDYAISVRDANGCVGTTTATIVAATGSLSVDLTADRTVVLSGQDIHLTATAVSDSPIVQYQWQTDSAVFDYSNCADTADCSNPIVRPSVSTYVIVTAINSQGCATSDTLYVEVKAKGPDTYFFPTAFTPNGDGLNDRFEFNVLGCTRADVKIWNRWGQQVYSNPYQANGFTGTDGWDGTYGGKKAQFDTYTYQIVLSFFDNHTETVAGTITVME